MHQNLRRPAATTAALAATALVTSLLTPTFASADVSASGNNGEVKSTLQLRRDVTVKGMVEHLTALDAIGQRFGNRVAGGPGYDASVAYIVRKLERAGYTPVIDEFEFVFNADATPAVLDPETVPPLVDGVDYASMTFSPNGDVTAPAFTLPTPDDGDTTPGCEAADFAGFPVGAVAVIRRGSCTFATKGANAAAAGAVATVVFNNAPGTVNGTLGGVPTFNIPVIGTTPEVGAAITDGEAVRVKVDRLNETRTTVNVLADLVPAGSDVTASAVEDIILVGAHLDSVPRGPGINDNGSGSAGILEIAEEMAARGDSRLTNTVRFAWWGAEEFGLLGSEAYVEELKTDRPEELARIKANLNYDMIGSPNYARFVYDGDNSAFPVGPGSEKGPQGSAEIERIYTDYFKSVGLASGETPFSGRSDYGPFIAEGIPAGGLFTGAEGVKTESQVSFFGGTAGVAYDPCYHLNCDTLANVNRSALNEMGDAAAHAVGVLSQRDLTERPLRSYSRPISGVATTPAGGGLHEDHDHDGELS